MQKEREQILEFIRNRCESKLKDLLQFEISPPDYPEIPHFSKREYQDCEKRVKRIISGINAINVDIANQLDQYQNMLKLAEACLKLQ